MKYNYAMAMHQYETKYKKPFSQIGLTQEIAKKFFPLMILRPVEAYQLFCCAKEIPDGGLYLEIGSWFGATLICVYEATKLMEKTINLITIEAHAKKEFLHNTKSIPNLRLIRTTSDFAVDEIQDNSIDLMFLKNNHDYKQACRDILNYWPKIKIGGVLLGHDYIGGQRFKGVKEAADETFGKKLMKPEYPNRIFQVDKIQDRKGLNIPLDQFARMESELKCDIIVPTYNRPKFLRRAIQSVLDQTSPYWELWIYDDGSDYDIGAIVREFGDKRIHLIQGEKLTEIERKDRTSAIPRNALLAASSNEIIVYLDDDNYLWPGAIEAALRYFIRYPERDTIYCKLTYSDRHTDNVPKELRKFRMFRYGRLDTGQIIHRRKCLDWLFEKWHEYWPSKALVCADYHLQKRLQKKFHFYPLEVCFINKYIHSRMYQGLRREKRSMEAKRE